VFQHLGLALEQTGHGPGLGHGDQHPGAGVLQDPGVAQQVLLQLGGTGGGIDGHRHPTGQQGAEEAEEVAVVGGQHQGHPIPRRHPVAHQPGSHPARALPQLSVKDGAGVVAIAVEEDMGTIRVGLHMPRQHLRHGAGVNRLPGALLRHLHPLGQHTGLPAPGHQHRLQQLPGSLREQRLLRQADREVPPHPAEQLGAPPISRDYSPGNTLCRTSSKH